MGILAMREMRRVLVGAVRGEDMTESIACIRCQEWRSLNNQVGHCVRQDKTGRCQDGHRGLYPTTFALDGCCFGTDRRTQEGARSSG